MTIDEVQKLQHGLYRIFWKDEAGGGSSLAAVGSTCSGKRWLAPTNWTFEAERRSLGPVTTDWTRIERVELIEASRY